MIRLTIAALVCTQGLAGAAEPPSLPDNLRQILTQADGFEAPRRVGVRAAVQRAAQRVIPTVVVVGSTADYVEAIAAWDGLTRFPVLIDDRSPRAQEDIARFVRAFEPESVVRWSGGGEWPAPAPAREQRLNEAWADALGMDPVTSQADAVAALRAGGITPPGMVITSATDPAWTGALALAAGRNQPLGLIDDPGGIASGFWPLAKIESIAGDIERLAEQTTLAWNEAGDDLDAITLALDAPLNFRDDRGGNQTYAVSDVLGRDAQGQRWAWASQLVGNETTSAYRAMCALFLEAHSAWTFDAYPVTGDWTRYDNAPAVRILSERGMDVTDLDSPHSGLEDWRHATLAPIDADLVLINSKGAPHQFDLNPGRGYPADVPHLNHPVILHLIHSFSLARGDGRTGVGGRWLERGAYAALGSVDEPYLRAFMPPEILAGRLAIGYPWAAAVRADGANVWKLAALGDPLITLSSGGRRVDDALPLRDSLGLDDESARRLAEGDPAGAARALAMLGRDAQAADIAIELLEGDSPDAVGPELALAALAPAYRSGRLADCVHLALAQHAAVVADPIALDTAWTAARALLAERGADHGLALDLMSRSIRGDQVIADAVEVGDAIKRREGALAAGAFIDEVVALAKRAEDKRRLTEIAEDYRSGRR